jgi:hypothetical protein
VFVVASLLRLVLATVNREQSDNHVSVINSIAFENTFPEYDRDLDWVKEAFQPKLYHATVAGILKLDPSDMESRPCISEYPGSPHVIWVGQMVNCTAGILTLWVVLRFLRLVGLSERTTFFTFSLVALNPALIGINMQVTNDSFVILFGSLSLYWGYRFFRDFRLKDFIWMTVAATATAMSKATGLPICLAITLGFAITLARAPADGTPGRATVAWYATVFLVAVLSSLTIVAPKIGSYWELYRRYGSPFVTNRVPEPFPRLFEHTIFTGDPGVRSISESLFTFRIIGLLRDPMLLGDTRDSFPLHRTSLWSQVYGRVNFAQFDGYLESWRPRSALVTNTARLTYLVALFPAALLLLGASRAIARVVSDAGGVRPHQWLIGISAAGYTAFLIVLALRYRDFSFFKPIHALAGLLAFLVPFGRACDRFYAERDGRPGMRAGDALLGALIVLYTVNCTFLAVQLLQSCLGA